jgi:hypothetical protein
MSKKIKYGRESTIRELKQRNFLYFLLLVRKKWKIFDSTHIYTQNKFFCNMKFDILSASGKNPNF